jgi:hypothetical protein
MKSWPIWLAAILASLAFIFYAAMLIWANWPITQLTLEQTGLFGDSFGVINAFFTGGAFLLILWTIVIQQRELRLQQQEMSRMVAVQEIALHRELLKYAMEDEALAKVWGSRTPIDHDTFRQVVYVNMILSQWGMMYEEELISKSELEFMLSMHMEDSLYFRKFWTYAAHVRRKHATLSPKYREFHELAEQAFASASKNKGADLKDSA